MDAQKIDEFLKRAGYDSARLSDRYRIRYDALDVFGEEALPVLAKYRNEQDNLFRDGKITDDYEVDVAPPVLTSFGLAVPVPQRAISVKRSVSVDDIQKEREQKTSFSEGMEQGITRSGIGSLIKELLPSEDKESFNRESYRADQLRAAGKYDSGYDKGKLVGGIVTDLPMFVQMNPAMIAGAMGLSGAAQEENRQQIEGEERGLGKVAAYGLADAAGGLLGMKAGNFVRGAVPVASNLVKGGAEALTDATVNTGITNLSKAGYNLAAGNEDKDRLEEMETDFLGNMAGYGVFAGMKGLHLAGKGVSGGIKSIPETLRTAKVKEVTSKVERPVAGAKIDSPEIVDIVKKPTSEWTNEDVAAVHTALRQAEMGLSSPTKPGEIVTKEGMEKYHPDQVPAVHGKFSDGAYETAKSYEAMIKAEDPVQISAAKQVYEETKAKYPQAEKESAYLQSKIDKKELSLDGTFQREGRIFTEPKFKYEDSEGGDVAKSWMILEAQKKLSHVVNEKASTAYSVKHLLNPKTWAEGYRGSKQPAIEKAKQVLYRSFLDRREGAIREIHKVNDLVGGGKKLPEMKMLTRKALMALDRTGGDGAEAQMRIKSASDRWMGTMKAIKKKGGQAYANSVLESATNVATVIRLYNLCKMGGDHGRLPKGWSMANLEDMMRNVDHYLEAKGVSREDVDSVLREMETNAKEVRDILYESGALSPEVLKKWEESGLYIPISHELVTSPDINKTLIDALDKEAKRYRPQDNLFRLTKSEELLNTDYERQVAGMYANAVQISNRYKLMTAILDMTKGAEAHFDVKPKDVKEAAKAQRMRDIYNEHRELFEKGEAMKTLAPQYNEAKSLRDQAKQKTLEARSREAEADKINPDMKGKAKEEADLLKTQAASLEEEMGRSREYLKLVRQIEMQLKEGGEAKLEKYLAQLEAKSGDVEKLKDLGLSSTATEKADQKITIYRPDNVGETHVLYASRKFLDDLMQIDSGALDRVATFASTFFLGKYLRAAATVYNPAFGVVNIARDVWHHALVDSQGILTDNRKIAPLATSLFHLVVYDGRKTAEGERVGGSISQIIWDAAFNKKKYQQLVDNFVKDGGARMGSINEFKSMNKEVSIGARKWFEKMTDAIEFSERVTRMAIYEKGRKVLPEKWEGLVQKGVWDEVDLRDAMSHTGELAAWSAARSIDFTQGGSVTRVLSGIFPYTNAGWQSTRAVIRAGKEDPARFALKMAEFSTAVVAISAWNAMFPEYEDALPTDKTSGFTFIIPWMKRDAGAGEIRTGLAWMPIPQELAPLKAIIENIVLAKSKGVDTKQLVAAFGMAFPANPATMENPAFAAYQAYFANWDSFFQDKVWKGPQVRPGDEVTSDTHAFYRLLGEAAPEFISPARLERAVSAVIPASNTFNALASYSFDAMAEQMGQMPDDHRNTLAVGLAKASGLGRFVRETKPSYWAYDKQREDVAATQERIGEAQILGRNYGKGWADAVASGDFDKAEEIQAEFKDKIEKSGILDSPEKTLAAYRSFRGSRSNRLDAQRKILQPYYHHTDEEEEE